MDTVGRETSDIYFIENILESIPLFNNTSELPVKIFTDSGKFTNVHAKNIHWYNSENKCFLPIITAKEVVYIHINIYELSYAV